MFVVVKQNSILYFEQIVKFLNTNLLHNYNIADLAS